MTTTTTYSPGDRVRVARFETSYYGSTGTVAAIDAPEPLPIIVNLHGTGSVRFRAKELEPLPDPTDPTSTPDDPDRPVGEVIDVVPGALVRQPAGSRRQDPADAPSSSQAGLAALIPLRETVPPQAARDLMAGAGIDMDGFDRALAQAREGAEERAGRPALAAYDDGHAQGHRDGLTAALRIVERLTDDGRAEGEDPDPGGLIRAELLAAIKAEVRP